MVAGCGATYNIATTFGWIGFLAQQAVDSAGMSVVFARPNQQLTACSGGPAGCPTGSTCTPAGCALDAAVAACATATIEGQGCNTPLVSAGACVSGVCQPSLGVVRYGANPPEDLTVFEAIASRSHGAEAVLEPGATYYYRVFLVFDALSTGLHPRSNMLARHVSQGRLDFPLSDSGLLRTCDHIGGTTGIPCNWYTFDRPVPNARPLLLVRDHVTGALLYSTTPYALSFTPSNRRTDFVAMVGWVLPRTTTVAPDPRWRALSDLLDASQFPDPGAGRGDAWIVTTP